MSRKPKADAQQLVLDLDSAITPSAPPAAADSAGRGPLPEGWIWTMLGYVTDINPRITTIRDLPDNTAVTFAPMAAVNAEKGSIVYPEERLLKEVRKGLTPFVDGDVLFAKITPCMENGKAAIAQGLRNGIGFGSTEFHILRPKELITPQWVFHFVRQESFRQDAKAHFAGTAGQLRVPASFLHSHPIPLPPLPTQQRIVARIEELFSQLDAGVTALRRVQAGLKRYKASVLKAACEGRLVPQDAGDEPAEVMLRRLGKEPLKGEGLGKLPEGWCWARVGEIANIGTGATPLRSKVNYWEDGTIPWITSSALNALQVDSAEEYITESALKETNTKIFPAGSLLVAMYGEGKTRGKVSELMIEATTNQACAALVFDSLSLSFKPYVKIFFQQNYESIRRLSSGGVQPNLNLSIIRNTIFPFPPLSEQRRIVAEVERRLSVTQEVEAVVNANLQRAGRLRQAILKAAFEGRLV